VVEPPAHDQQPPPASAKPTRRDPASRTRRCNPRAPQAGAGMLRDGEAHAVHASSSSRSTTRPGRLRKQVHVTEHPPESVRYACVTADVLPHIALRQPRTAVLGPVRRISPSSFAPPSPLVQPEKALLDQPGCGPVDLLARARAATRTDVHLAGSSRSRVQIGREGLRAGSRRNHRPSRRGARISGFGRDVLESGGSAADQLRARSAVMEEYGCPTGECPGAVPHGPGGRSVGEKSIESPSRTVVGHRGSGAPRRGNAARSPNRRA